MALVFAIAAALWGIGWAMKAPPRLRWALIGVLWLAVVVAQLVLPPTQALRVATGGSAAPWLLLGGAALMVALYRRALGWLRTRATAHATDHAAPPASTATFSDTELSRYARHIMLRELGGPGQRKLKEAQVLVIGAGGLGSPALMYLAAAGVGQIGIVDDDVVDGSNLQRQVIHTDARIGMPKVFSAQEQLQALNPFVDVRPYNRRLGADDAETLFAEYDIIMDGSDNFDTRYLANSVAHRLGKPLVSGALTQWEGQLSVIDTANGTPCYQCTFPQRPAPGLVPSCAEAGVFGPLPGIIGTMMAAEAAKVITGAGAPLRGTMVIYDALYAEQRRITLKKRPDCPICGQATPEPKES